ncbi:MAG: crossover junction endodeoxyribonuclease RuvC [Alphaproteobacteria bacterium]|nr:crossover junction endodeoxyribonuclease RuvC [Alphaproteobacteria bacterium]
MRLLGLDAGLRKTGWGIIDVDNNHLRYIADGVITSNAKLELSERLAQLHAGVKEVVELYNPDESAVEETFVNRNPASALKLGHARGVIMLAPALAGIIVAEYAPNKIKKAVVGAGHASKQQIIMMVRTLLPACKVESEDAADALAVAICHAHMRNTRLSL